MPAIKVLGILLLLSLSLFMLVWVPDHFALLSDQAPSSSAYQATSILQLVAVGMGLLTGPFLFWVRFREPPLSIHFHLGTIYVVACFLSGLAGLMLLAFARLSLANVIALILLNAIWLVTIVMAIRTMRSDDLAANRRWLLRSFSLTFSAVTLRLLVVLFFDETNSSISPLLLWLGWVPNLFLMELFICRELKAAEKASA